MLFTSFLFTSFLALVKYGNIDQIRQKLYYHWCDREEKLLLFPEFVSRSARFLKVMRETAVHSFPDSRSPFPVPGSRFPVPGSPFPVPRSRFPVTGFSNIRYLCTHRSLHVPPFCFMVNSRKTRSIAWESAQLSTWVKFMRYDWLSLNRLGNTGSRGRSKNNLRGTMVGIGPIWGDYLSYLLILS